MEVTATDGLAGPLLTRAASVFVPSGELPDDDLPAAFAAVVLQLKVSAATASTARTSSASLITSCANPHPTVTPIR